MSESYVALKNPKVIGSMGCSEDRLIEFQSPVNNTDGYIAFSSLSCAREFAKACLRAARELEDRRQGDTTTN